jgi:hypothetical protein
MSATTYKIDVNTRVICGNVMHRRFAYLHKKDWQMFGLLLALDMKDARKHLGSGFLIRKTWLSSEEEMHCFKYERIKEIVESIFCRKSI